MEFKEWQIEKKEDFKKILLSWVLFVVIFCVIFIMANDFFSAIGEYTRTIYTIVTWGLFFILAWVRIRLFVEYWEDDVRNSHACNGNYK